MRLKLSSSGSSVFVSSLFGVLSLLTASCGGDEPVNGTTDTADNNDTGAEESSEGSTGDGNNASGSDGPNNSEGPSPTPTATDSSSPPTDVPALPTVGVSCTRDDDCPSPLSCIRTDDSFRGAIPGSGICTMPCETSEQCQAVDGFGICSLLGAPTDEAISNASAEELPEGLSGYCLQWCPYGVSTDYKCNGLGTSACFPPSDDTVITANDGTEFQEGVCVPICSSDADCEDGEFCDAGWGLCVPDEVEGKELGEKCDPDAETRECKSGFCLGIAEEVPFGICTSWCNVHADTIVCNGTPGTDAEFGCFSNLFTPVASALNDVGQCLPLCNTDDDCPDALACDLSDPDTLTEIYGRPGMCFPTEESIAEASEGTADAGSDVTTEPEPPAAIDAGDGANDGG